MDRTEVYLEIKSVPIRDISGQKNPTSPTEIQMRSQPAESIYNFGADRVRSL